MNLAPDHQRGLALGSWGAVQASAAGVAIALGGIIRDLVAHHGPHGTIGAAAPYDCVFGLEIALLLATIIMMAPLVRHRSTVPEVTEAIQNRGAVQAP